LFVIPACAGMTVVYLVRWTRERRSWWGPLAGGPLSRI